MIQLPNGNYCSSPSVHPKDWEKAKADFKKDWYIQYRFYTPTTPKGRLVIIKSGLNYFNTLVEKRTVAKRLLKDLNEALQNGYDPTQGVFLAPPESDHEIDPKTRICKALSKALGKLTVEKNTRQDMSRILPHVEKAARFLQIDTLPIKDVRKRHVKMILERLSIDRAPRWTAKTFNHYRKYLSILFNELEEMDAIEINPVTAIAKQKTITKAREVLTDQQRRDVSKHLREHHYRFWLFTQIFFHSGARETEILKVKGSDVNLEKQYVRITIIKGSSRREVMKTIKDVALPYWTELMQDCKPEQYVFSYHLKPGLKQIRPEQITRRWRAHVKVKLGITADFYSLKHLNSDDTSRLLSLADAGAHNSHTSTKTTMIYAVNEKERQQERIKKLGNEF